MSAPAKTTSSTAKIDEPDCPAQPVLSFDQVIAAVASTQGLTDGVRGNIVSALRRAGSLMPGAAGTTGIVNIPALGRRLEKVTPAKLGFKHAGSLSAFKSNLQRGLQLAAFTVMPGRHSSKLTAQWATLLQGIEDEKIRRSLSRLAHVASDHGWEPHDISDAHIDRFRHLVDETCLKSKAKKMIRSTVKAWNSAGQAVPDWPSNRLDTGQIGDWYYSLPWSAFPPSFEVDVDAYLARGISALDFLEESETEGAVELPFIEPRTRGNYRDGLKRAASILVKTGVPADTITGICSLVDPKRANAILTFLSKRLQRTDGGLLGVVAMLIYTAARDWVYPNAVPGSTQALDVQKLKKYFVKTKLKSVGMSEKTQVRLAAFDDPRVLAEYLALPKELVAKASKLAVNQTSAKLVRLALFIAIEIDTLLRPGNVVGLSLKDHIQPKGEGAKRELFIALRKTKNGMAFSGKLRPSTVRIFETYMSRYRSVHATSQSDWLFPGTKGQHWTEIRACEALSDYCAKHLGIDMTPHVHRSLGGKIILTANPGALVEVQHALVHKNLTTTRTSYIPYEMAATQDRYHALLTGHDKAKGARLRS